MNHPLLWPEITVLQRGWLSANNYLFQGPEGAALVDTGYCAHAAQTVALVQQVLGDHPLHRILNTHLHSDHCGGNAALQAAYPQVQTSIAPGHAAHVRDWNPQALGYIPSGQQCPPFRADALLQPGTTTVLGGRPWQIIASPGHDPHSIILFEPEKRILISADALWENGFGVIFEEIDGGHAFADAAATLDVIASLHPTVVLPGHGALFTDVDAALERARSKLAGYRADPHTHARYAAKVLLKYKLLEQQRMPITEVQAWLQATPYLHTLHARYASHQSLHDWMHDLIASLVRSGAAQVDGDVLINQ